MAQNHVWRYTLRLFHTFALFGKSGQIYAKKVDKSMPKCTSKVLLFDKKTSLSHHRVD